MSDLLEIVTEVDGVTGAPCEWLMLRRRAGYVTFQRDYLSEITGHRQTWVDEGISVNDEDLPAIVAALAALLPTEGEEKG
ncbi:MAG: hypothetical protein KF850_33090 [Labilithrix sp.]|nr:hypothetical protein [Labilithrix sp.]MBX3216915.1 hypothetical protein [Labilithrix sp.]